MIVRLTHPQITSVRARIPELHSTQMQLHRTRANRIQSDIELPAIAWRQIVDHLKADAFGPMGGRRSHLPPSLYLAIAKIQDAVNEMETHPALQSRGAVGFLSDVIPAWRSDLPGQWYEPYPNDHEFVALVPRHHGEHNRRFTTWSEAPPLPVRMTEEEGFHLLFCVRVDEGHIDDVDRAGVD